MSTHLRPEVADDRPFVATLIERAFGGNAEAMLVDALRDGGYAEVSLIAQLNGDIVGHIMFSRITIRTDRGWLDGLSLAPLAVDPPRQRRGIGSQLVEAGLLASRAAGHQLVVVLGEPEYYRRFGFSSELARPLESPFGGGDASMALELVPGTLADVSGRIEYSPPFMSLG
jgi:putative acetyltransferase